MILEYYSYYKENSGIQELILQEEIRIKNKSNYIPGISQEIIKRIQKGEGIDHLYIQASNEEIEKVINYFLTYNQEYTLEYSTPLAFRRNLKLCELAITNNPCRHLYVDWDYFSKSPNELFELLSFLSKINSNAALGYLYGLVDEFSLSILSFPQYREAIIDLIIASISEKEKIPIIKRRLEEIISIFFASPLEISKMNYLINIYLENEWLVHRRMNSRYYNNLFDCMCKSIQFNNNLEDGIEKFGLLSKIASILNDDNVFADYKRVFTIYHSENEEDRALKINLYFMKLREKIARYIAKSKEKFIKDKYQDIIEEFKVYYKPKSGSIPLMKIQEQKRKKSLAVLFSEGNSDILEKIRQIKERVLANEYEPLKKHEKIIDRFVEMIITTNCSFEEAIDSLGIEPKRGREYEQYLVIKKLINRLNNNYIEFGHKKVQRYADYIGYDGKKYYYIGQLFDKASLTEIREYEKLKYVLRKITGGISKLAKEINIDENLTNEEIDEYYKSIPFNDDNYEFDRLAFKNQKTPDLLKILKFNTSTITDDNYYQIFKQLLLDSQLLQMRVVLSIKKIKGMEYFFSSYRIDRLINIIPELSMAFNDDYITYKQLGVLLHISNSEYYDDLKILHILEPSVINKIQASNNFLSPDFKVSKRPEMAARLASTMVSKTKSTVPYISGQTNHYDYSMYLPTDTSILVSGIDTKSCFRLIGYESDFLTYCALNKNGFVIKITDKSGKLIAKVPGCRNGNGIYFGQILTIYRDSDGYEELVELLKEIATRFITISKNNEKEEKKIEFALFISDKDYCPTLGTDSIKKIGECPIERKSNDWYKFRQYPDLNDPPKSNSILTDYNREDREKIIKILVSSIGELTPDKIKQGDIPPLYDTIDTKIVNVESRTEDNEIYINRIRAMQSCLNKKKFTYLRLPNDCIVYSGYCWYIILSDGEIIDKTNILEDNEEVSEVYNSVLATIISDNDMAIATSY